jgi:hypothetical protein
MAVGETSGQSGPRRLITAGGGRRRIEQGEPGSALDEGLDDVLEDEVIEEEVAEEEVAEEVVEAPAAVAPEGEEAPAEPETPARDLLELPTEPDDLERQLAQDEQMERQTRHEHHETPHFRREAD